MDHLDVCSKPLVDWLLNVDILFLCKFAHEVIHIWLKKNWKTKHGVGALELATCALRKIVLCFHDMRPFLYCLATVQTFLFEQRADLRLLDQALFLFYNRGHPKRMGAAAIEVFLPPDWPWAKA